MNTPTNRIRIQRKYISLIRPSRHQGTTVCGVVGRAPALPIFIDYFKDFQKGVKP